MYARLDNCASLCETLRVNAGLHPFFFACRFKRIVRLFAFGMSSLCTSIFGIVHLRPTKRGVKMKCANCDSLSQNVSADSST